MRVQEIWDSKLNGARFGLKVWNGVRAYLKFALPALKDNDQATWYKISDITNDEITMHVIETKCAF